MNVLGYVSWWGLDILFLRLWASIMALTESFSVYSSLFRWHLIYHFYSQFAILIYTQFPYPPRSISLLQFTVGQAFCTSQNLQIHERGKVKHSTLWKMAKNVNESSFIFYVTFVMLHAQSILNCTSDLFNNSRKCQEKMQSSSFPLVSPRRSHFSRSMARAYDKIVKVPETSHQFPSSFPCIQGNITHSCGTMQGACFRLLCLKDAVEQHHMSQGKVERKSALKVALSTRTQASPTSPFSEQSYLYPIRLLKRRLWKPSIRDPEEWKLERKEIINLHVLHQSAIVLYFVFSFWTKGTMAVCWVSNMFNDEVKRIYHVRGM